MGCFEESGFAKEKDEYILHEVVRFGFMPENPARNVSDDMSILAEELAQRVSVPFAY